MVVGSTQISDSRYRNVAKQLMVHMILWTPETSVGLSILKIASTLEMICLHPLDPSNVSRPIILRSASTLEMICLHLLDSRNVSRSVHLSLRSASTLEMICLHPLDSSNVSRSVHLKDRFNFGNDLPSSSGPQQCQSAYHLKERFNFGNDLSSSPQM